MNPIAPRRPVRALAGAALCLAALASLGFPGCPDGVTGPGGTNPDALTMSNCWPNDDGRQWTYATTYQSLEFTGIPYTPLDQDVPGVTLADARRLLRMPVTPESGGAAAYQFQLRFDGMRTSQSGAVGQNLVETAILPGLGGAATVRTDSRGGFLARLAEARPDLRARLAAAGVAPDPANSAPRAGRVPLASPNFIHGYVWEKTTAWIGTYGDIDQSLAWKFLESNLRVGHAFRHQLVPALASDVWLHASVERSVSVDVPGGRTVANAIEVLYLVDYGESVATDQSGTPFGKFRQFDYGQVVYAPGVGPVSDLERRMAFAGESHTLGLVLLELDLESTGVTAPAPRVALDPR